MNRTHHTVLLASVAPHRRVWLCRHGALHLQWDHVTVHLATADFEHLADVLDKSARFPYLDAVQHGRCSLCLSGSDVVRLLIGNMMLFLTATDVALLRHLVLEAARHLESGATLLEPPSASAGTADVPFSLN